MSKKINNKLSMIVIFIICAIWGGLQPIIFPMGKYGMLCYLTSFVGAVILTLLLLITKDYLNNE